MIDVEIVKLGFSKKGVLAFSVEFAINDFAKFERKNCALHRRTFIFVSPCMGPIN